jgi:ABC-type lipoprotein export system ATPase subunit
MNILEATGISKIYPRGSEEVHALRGVSLSVEPSSFMAIVGPSGAGKTALVNIIGCLDNPTRGTLVINGTEVTGRAERELVHIRRNTLGFVFQQFYLIPTLTAEENITLPLLFSRKSVDKSKLETILERVGLSDRADHLPRQLSGGEMQRVAIGRALINNPKILLADEPTGNLDTVTAGSIFALLRELNRDGLTVIMVTHNPDLAQQAERIITLRDGLIQSDQVT